MLHSLGIPYEIIADASGCMLVVPQHALEKAKFEIWQYDSENRSPNSNVQAIKPVYQNAVPGVIAYIVIVILVAWLAGEATFNKNWYAAGRVDGSLIRDGEWWRTVTALTLHSGLRHLS